MHNSVLTDDTVSGFLLQSVVRSCVRSPLIAFMFFCGFVIKSSVKSGFVFLISESDLYCTVNMYTYCILGSVCVYVGVCVCVCVCRCVCTQCVFWMETDTRALDLLLDQRHLTGTLTSP